LRNGTEMSAAYALEQCGLLLRTFQQVLWTDVLRHELKSAVALQPSWG
jgi:hypothetical protein